jgi:Mrp family chromosome partitioning ATPase
MSPQRRGGVLEALLVGGERAVDLLEQAPNPHLRLLLGSDDRAAPSARIDYDRIRGLLEQLRLRSDDVLVDTPPVSAVADASAVAAVSDQVILVIDLKRIRRKELLAAKEQLTNGRAKIMGIVLNRVAAGSSTYYFPPDHAQVNADGAAGPARPPTFSA